MKFGIQNLGPIKEANIEIGDLTIICGKNNCGKTYFTYSLYAFLATIQRNFVFEIEKQYFDKRNTSTLKILFFSAIFCRLSGFMVCAEKA